MGSPLRNQEETVWTMPASCGTRGIYEVGRGTKHSGQRQVCALLRTLVYLSVVWSWYCETKCQFQKGASPLAGGKVCQNKEKKWSVYNIATNRTLVAENQGTQSLTCVVVQIGEGVLLMLFSKDLKFCGRGWQVFIGAQVMALYLMASAVPPGTKHF